MAKNGRILFNRPKPTVGCSASGRRRFTLTRDKMIHDKLSLTYKPWRWVNKYWQCAKTHRWSKLCKKVHIVSFFYIVSQLFNALGPSFIQLCDSAGKKMFFVLCATTNAPHFSLPCHLKIVPFNCIFLKVAGCAVWSVRRMLRAFKFKTSAVLNILWAFFFIVAPCILKSILFTYQQMHCLLNLERFKILH
jgi:hypothetical protein